MNEINEIRLESGVVCTDDFSVIESQKAEDQRYLERAANETLKLYGNPKAQVQGSPAIWANRLAKTLRERDEARNHADKLAEALRDIADYGCGYGFTDADVVSGIRNKAAAALAEWERGKQ